MKGRDWGSLVPGIATAVFSAVSPAASWAVLWSLGAAEPRIKTILDTPEVRAVPDLFLQLNSLFISATVAVVTAIYYLTKGGTKGTKTACWIAIIPSVGVFLYVYVLGGATKIPFDKYIHPGPFTLDLGFPDFGIWINQARIMLIVIGIILAVIGSRLAKSEGG